LKCPHKEDGREGLTQKRKRKNEEKGMDLKERGRGERR